MRYLGASAVALLGALATVGSSSNARACGGCFHGPPPPNQTPDVITDHRMIFRISPQQTTLYDEIEYQGSAASFAWVLPTKGLVTVGLSSDVVFSVLDGLTQPQIYAPNPPNCPSCPACDQSYGASGSSSGGGSGSSSGGGVTVIGQQTVGPYATVQLASTNPTALESWLGANGYMIPANVQPIVNAYVNEGFDFLVLKLAPGQGVSAMRPVRVTSPGAGLQLPLRMVAAGTGSTVGITLWVVGDGRYEPQNFPTFTIAASELTWDFNANTSNYTTLRAQKEAATHQTAWQVESVLQLPGQQITGPVEADVASNDYLPVPPSGASGDAGTDGGGAGDASTGETADQVRQDDLNILFPPQGSPSAWITRMRGDLSQTALASDLMLTASPDQSLLTNQLNVTKYMNAPACPAVPNPCPVCTGNGSGGGSGAGNGATGGGSGLGGSGCSTIAGSDDGNLGVILAGLAAAGIVAGRGRRRRS